MVIFGVDPGTATTGYGVLEKNKNGLFCLGYGTILTPKEKAPHERLLMLERGLGRFLRKYKPDIVAIERLYFFKNVRTALPVSEARGVILLAAARSRLPIQEFTPQQVKIAATGYGNATKQQVQAMVQRILKLKSLPKPDDAADALGVAIACSLLTRKQK